MKMSFKFMLCTFVLLALLSSCNNEELFIEPTQEVVEEPSTPEDEETPTEENPETPDDSGENSTDTTAPCDFDLSSLNSGDTAVINCVMDLGGAIITLPPNVTIVYEGGDIINGTINFSTNNTISGELLNNSLILGGSNPILEDPTFEFKPSRWGIVEGKVSSEVALRNRDILESIMLKVKGMGANTFKIGKMDAYFEVSLVTSGTTNQNFYASVEAINVPSDFNLEMTQETNLRVQPNGRKEYALLAIREAENVTISGGILHGDRDDHDYSDGSSHEWGYLMFLHAAVNSTVTGVKMINASGDGVKIQDLKFTFQPDFKPTHNVTVTNCIFDSNRRNNMSITGGYDVYINNNQFLNASIDTNRSTGVAPGYALDVEAVRGRDEATGELIYYERAERIYISNNVEKNSRAGGFTVAIGYDVTIQNNDVESGISFSLANGVKILNNRVVATASEKQSSGTGIKAGRSSSSDETIYNNLVEGNTVIGFGTGISVNNRDVDVKNNFVQNCSTGIVIKNLTNSNISYNEVESNRSGSIGIYGYSTYAKNVIMDNNTIDVDRNPFKFNLTNMDSEYHNYNLKLKNNTLITNDTNSTLIMDSYGIIIENNNLDHGIEVFNSESLKFTNNTINTENDHGFDFREDNRNMVVSDNKITVSDRKQCINIDSTTSASEINASNNTCN